MSESKASLVYNESSRAARATNPVLRNTNKHTNKKSQGNQRYSFLQGFPGPEMYPLTLSSDDSDLSPHCSNRQTGRVPKGQKPTTHLNPSLWSTSLLWHQFQKLFLWPLAGLLPDLSRALGAELWLQILASERCSGPSICHSLPKPNPRAERINTGLASCTAASCPCVTFQTLVLHTQ